MKKTEKTGENEYLYYNNFYQLYQGSVRAMMGPDWRDNINYDALRKDRLERAKNCMKKYNLAGLLCLDSRNVRYVTGTHCGMHRYSLTNADGESIIFELGDVGIQTRRNAPWIKPENVRCSIIWHGPIGALIDYMTPSAQLAQRMKFVKGIVDALKDLGVGKGERVGIDVPDGKVVNALKEAGVNIVLDGWKTMMDARKIKTKYEIESFKIAAAICEACFETARENIRPGIKGFELKGLLFKTAYQQGAEAVRDFGVYIGKDTWPNYKSVCSTTIMRPGDIVYIDCLLSVNGYHTCYYRTFSLGNPRKETKDAYERIYKWLYDAARVIKPGATTKDVAEKWPDERQIWGLESADEGAANNWGHGLGLELYEPPMISRIWSLANPYPLESGMVIAIETQDGDGLGQGVRLEEMVLVTDTGFDILSKWPSEEITVC